MFPILQEDAARLPRTMASAVLYDIHGNLAALLAVLNELEQIGVDEIVVGGDVVPGPLPRQCLTELARVGLPIRYISGNGEREILLRRRGGTSPMPPGYEPMLRWVAAQLDASDAAAMDSWPATLRMTLPVLGHVLFCHASPRNDSDVFTRLTPEENLLPIIEPAGVDVVVCGHTHMPFDRMVGSTRVVNAGSVGMPFDRPGASWLRIGESIEFHHTPYDFDAAAELIRSTAYPGADDFARAYVLSAPGEAAMLQAYASVPLAPAQDLESTSFPER
jgi:diadenosine tetraphosphatase ApaH/serine/threonine PP2A family protein phosphatase